MKNHQKPNVLFFFSDQHSMHHIGAYGGDIVRTPTLDRLADDGYRFDNCYCQSPLCVPSRSSLFAGKYVRNILTYENDCILDTSRHIPFPKLVSNEGYRSCVIGKQHINGEQFMGFKQRPYGDYYGQGHQPDPYRDADERQGKSGLGEVRNGGYFELSGPTGIPEFQISEHIISYEAVKWLQEHKELHLDEPFFLMLNFPKPHWPYNPPAGYFDLYKDAVHTEELDESLWEKDVPYIQNLRKQWGVTSGNKADMDKALAAYLGCITHIDALMGSIIESLEYLGFAENTMIVYSTDHGDMAGEHNLWQKGCFYEGSAGVPLIIKMPKDYPGGKHIEENVGLLDLYPTFCDVCGVGETESLELEGRSLLSLIEGSGDSGRDAVFSEIGWRTFAGDAGCMVKKGNLKYNYYLESGHEMYDLEDDPDERNNLIGNTEYADTEAELRKLAEEFFEPQEFNRRYASQLRFHQQKFRHTYSNQYVLSDGTIIDARP